MSGNESLRAGTAEAEISPPPGVELAGYPHEPRRNTGIHDPLRAACLVLDDGRTRLAIVSTDLLMISKAVVRRVRESAGKACGIPAGNIMVTASHSHSAPWTSGMLDLEALERGGRPDPDYLRRTEDTLARLVTEAAASAFPARVAIGRGRCGAESGVGGNRRDPKGPADPDVWVLGVRDGKDRIRSCLVRYALHPTVLHADNTLVSADYVGFLRQQVVEAHPQAAVLFCQGPSGNQSTRYFRSGQTFEEAERIGRTIGREAVRVLESLAPADGVRLGAASVEVPLELKGLPPRTEAQRAVTLEKSAVERLRKSGADGLAVWNAELRLYGAENTLAYVLARERGTGLSLESDELPAEVQVMGIGDARIVGMQGELFVEFGLMTRWMSAYDATFVVELANGCLPGYACTRLAMREGGYEAGASLLTGRAGEQLVDAAARLLEKDF